MHTHLVHATSPFVSATVIGVDDSGKSTHVPGADVDGSWTTSWGVVVSFMGMHVGLVDELNMAI